MRSVEVSAKTREEAIGIALEQLGVDRAEVHVEIVDEGSSGIFGFGARPVKLRVSTEIAGPAPRRQREEQAPSRSSQRPAQREKAQASNRGRDAAPRPSRDGAPPAPRERSPRPERPPRDAAPKPAQTSAPADPQLVGEAAALLKEVIHLMGIDASITSAPTDDGGICLKVDSPDSAILIGRKGRNLSSMQYLLNRMVHTGEGDESERIVIDIEGYLDRRHEALEDMARRQAERAKETRRRVRLKPMSPQERRVIHMVLEDDPDVKTFSVGEAMVRSVIIAPADELPQEEQRGPRGRGGSHRGEERNRDQGPTAAAPGQNPSPRRSSRRGGRGRRRRSPGGPREESKVMVESESAPTGESSDS